MHFVGVHRKTARIQVVSCQFTSFIYEWNRNWLVEENNVALRDNFFFSPFGSRRPFVFASPSAVLASHFGSVMFCVRMKGRFRLTFLCSLWSATRRALGSHSECRFSFPFWERKRVCRFILTKLIRLKWLRINAPSCWINFNSMTWPYPRPSLSVHLFLCIPCKMIIPRWRLDHNLQVWPL